MQGSVLVRLALGLVETVTIGRESPSGTPGYNAARATTRRLQGGDKGGAMTKEMKSSWPAAQSRNLDGAMVLPCVRYVELEMEKDVREGWLRRQ